MTFSHLLPDHAVDSISRILPVALLSACSDSEDTIVEPGGGEEANLLLSLNEGYDDIRYGARLILVYEPRSNSFVGTVENTTSSILRQVRVEVHLSNGVELGPTDSVDMQPGEIIQIVLEATSESFTTWTAHPEVGGSGDGSGGEGSEGSESGEGGSGDND